ncbi:response regulator [Pricia sp. S334]|uniref:Response regulator n=1 Tax=Pricia mediterranea TaxID=3076079 RepID=A0ABU3L646_9FLAO|nr:response regulator [Pricia sp. S334]MDT7828684.1 response regulator [Pricia sp. S334]
MTTTKFRTNKIDKACIIDDDPIFIYGTKRLMAEVGFCKTVLVFENGQDGIDGLNKITVQGERLPAVIFLDLNMPIMNGWEFLEDFTRIPNHNREKVIVYIVSSSIDPRELGRIKNYKVVNNYILKPITKEDLVNILERAS